MNSTNREPTTPPEDDEFEISYAVAFPPSWILVGAPGLTRLSDRLLRDDGPNASLVQAIGRDLAPQLEDAERVGTKLMGTFLDELDDSEPDLDIPVPMAPEDFKKRFLFASVALVELPALPGDMAWLGQQMRAPSGARPRWMYEPALLDTDRPTLRSVELVAMRNEYLRSPIDVMSAAYYFRAPEELGGMTVSVLFRTPSLSFSEEFLALFEAIVASVQVARTDPNEVFESDANFTVI